MALLRKGTFQGVDWGYFAYCDKPTSCRNRCRCKKESGHSGQHACLHS